MKLLKIEIIFYSEISDVKYTKLEESLGKCLNAVERNHSMKITFPEDDRWISDD